MNHIALETGTIWTEDKGDYWHARVDAFPESHPEMNGYGKTESEAIGNLVRKGHNFHIGSRKSVSSTQ